MALPSREHRMRGIHTQERLTNCHCGSGHLRRKRVVLVLRGRTFQGLRGVNCLDMSTPIHRTLVVHGGGERRVLCLGRFLWQVRPRVIFAFSCLPHNLEFPTHGWVILIIREPGRGHDGTRQEAQLHSNVRNVGVGGHTRVGVLLECSPTRVDDCLPRSGEGRVLLCASCLGKAAVSCTQKSLDQSSEVCWPFRIGFDHFQGRATPQRSRKW